MDEPRFESIEAARSWLVDRSPVISLEVGGAARAYPLAVSAALRSWDSSLRPAS